MVVIDHMVISRQHLLYFALGPVETRLRWAVPLARYARKCCSRTTYSVHAGVPGECVRPTERGPNAGIPTGGRAGVLNERLLVKQRKPMLPSLIETPAGGPHGISMQFTSAKIISAVELLISEKVHNCV